MIHQCEKCGTETVRGIIFTNVSNNIHPICDNCTQEHEETSREINAFEMDNFNGSYGLVTWEYIDLN